MYTNSMEDLWQIPDTDNDAAEKRITFISEAILSTGLYTKYSFRPENHFYCDFLESTSGNMPNLIVFCPQGRNIKMNTIINGDEFNPSGRALFIGLTKYTKDTIYNILQDNSQTLSSENVLLRLNYVGIEYTYYTKKLRKYVVDPENEEGHNVFDGYRRYKSLCFIGRQYKCNRNPSDGDDRRLHKYHRVKCFTDVCRQYADLNYRPVLNTNHVAAFGYEDNDNGAITLCFTQAVSSGQHASFRFTLTFGYTEGRKYAFGVRIQKLVLNDVSYARDIDEDDVLFAWTDSYDSQNLCSLSISSISEYLATHDVPSDKMFYGKVYLMKTSSNQPELRVDSKAFRPFYYRENDILSSGNFNKVVNYKQDALRMIGRFIAVDENL